VAWDAGIGDERVFPAIAVQVGAAEADHFDAEEDVAGGGLGLAGLAEGEVAGLFKDERFHAGPPIISLCGRFPPPSADTMKGPMKAFVYVTLKKTVLDAQGKTVTQALRGMGHAAIADVRQGKYFELTLAEGTDAAAARAEVEQIAAEVLSNPVIEDYRIELGE
jgi:phosphoribosylformylglycinamidine synthase